ncbi:MAG: methyl-accepting chemotaxis protein [Mobilitalea sp.]
MEKKKLLTKTKRNESTKKNKSQWLQKFNRIQVKLIIGFMLPVICIVALGIISYKKASTALIQNYEEALLETLDMTNQYYTYTFQTIVSDIEVYYQDTDLRDFYSGLMSISPTKEIQLFNANLDLMKRKTWSDELIENLYVLSDKKDSIATTGIKGEKMYSSYIQTEQGMQVAADPGRYFIFGADKALDDVFGSDSSTYGIRIARKYKDSNTCIVADVNLKAFKNTINRLDLGTGSLLGIVTLDGTEILADAKEELSGAAANEKGLEEAKSNIAVFKDKEFYTNAWKGEITATSEYVSYLDQEYMFAYSKLEGTDAMICFLIPKADIVKKAESIKKLTIIIVLFTCVLAVGIGTVIASYVSRTIKYLAKQLKKVAEGDLSIEINLKQKDEFMLLAQDITSMVINMKNLIQKIKLIGDEVYISADQVTNSSKTFVNSASDIKTSITEIESGVTQLDQNSADCLGLMDELSHKITLVNDNSKEIGNISVAAVQTIGDGILTMNTLTEKSKSTTQITGQVIDTIRLLEEKSRSIGQILNVINEIAQQTNLLSLNASIESARAGAYGVGFAVVAEEIRKLADQSLHSADRIRIIIKEIEECTTEAVKTAKEAENAVKQQEEAVSDTTTSFRDLEKQINKLSSELDSILANVQNMEKARSSTLEAVESISAISEETTACSITVSESAEKQLDAVTHLEEAAIQLLTRAKDLDKSINLFKIN